MTSLNPETANSLTVSSSETSERKVSIITPDLVITLSGKVNIGDHIHSVVLDHKESQNVLNGLAKTAPSERLGSKDQEPNFLENNKPLFSLTQTRIKKILLTVGLLLGGSGTTVVVNDTVLTPPKQPSSESCQIRLANLDTAYSQINHQTTETDSKVILGNCPSEQKEDVKEKTKIITWGGVNGQSISLTFKGGQLVEKHILTKSH